MNTDLNEGIKSILDVERWMRSWIAHFKIPEADIKARLKLKVMELKPLSIAFILYVDDIPVGEHRAEWVWEDGKVVCRTSSAAYDLINRKQIIG
jgi:hypothetical protein